MKRVKAVSYTAEVDWKKIVDNAWKSGFIAGQMFITLIVLLILAWSLIFKFY